MLVIAGSIQIDVTMRNELIETAIEVVRELRKQVGCTQVSLSADLEDPGILYLFQTWESQAALTASMVSSPYLDDAIGQHAGKLGVRELSLLKYDVASQSRVA